MTERRADITVRSVITDLSENGTPDGEETEEFTTTAAVKQSGGLTHISYREAGEGGAVVCDITVGPSGVHVRRRGAVVTDMHFGTADFSGIYEIPPYRFDMRIRTEKIRNGLTPDGGRLDLFYLLTVGGAPKRVHFLIRY